MCDFQLPSIFKASCVILAVKPPFLYSVSLWCFLVYLQQGKVRRNILFLLHLSNAGFFFSPKCAKFSSEVNYQNVFLL